MAILGALLKNKRAGEEQLAWNLAQLAGRETIDLASADFTHGGVVPTRHAGRRAGGENLSPALSWSQVPADTEQLLLVIEDVDSPTRAPFVHGVALLDPLLRELPAGALNAVGEGTVPGVRVLRSGMGRGYRGPEPIKGHGPHCYVFQLFALGATVTIAPGEAPLETAKPRAVLSAVPGPVLARGRLDGTYER